MSLICFGLARALLLVTLAAAPWLLGSVPAWSQVWIAGGVLASLACCILGCLSAMFTQHYTGTVRVPWTIFCLGLFCALGAAQTSILLPPAGNSSSWANEVMGEEAAADPSAGQHVASIAPWRTKWQTARIGIVILAVFLGAQLFRTPTALIWLLAVLALDGALLSIFGVVQSLSWNDQIFWSIPLRFGGIPFASFVNRNNAAGFLNICLGACFGGSLAAQALGSRENSDRASYGFVLLATITMAGLVACNSRGGLASMIIASVALIPLLWQGSPARMWQGLAAASLLAIGVAVWCGTDDKALERMKSLAEPAVALQGRWEHWADTAAALPDRPWLGSGWGTYQFLNPSFQNHETLRSFWNADNLYFELLMEGGWIAAGLMVLLLARLIADVRGTSRQGRDGVNQALTAVGGFVLVALGLQTATDFGILHFSLSLAAGVLAGAVGAQAITARRLAVRSASPAAPPSRAFSLAALIAIAALAGWSGLEISRLAPTISFREALPVDIENPDELSPAMLNDAIEHGKSLSSQFPEDGELHDGLAELSTFRFRLGMVNRLAPGAGVEARRQAWREARLEKLHQLSQVLRAPELFAELEQLPEVRENVPDILRESTAAMKASAWLPRPPVRLTLLSRFDASSGPQMQRLLRHSAVQAAGDPIQLVRLGNMALETRDDELAVLCWRRALRLRPKSFSVVLDAARRLLDDDHIAEKIFDQPEQWIQLSRVTRSLSARNVAAQQLRKSLSLGDSNRSPGQTAWIRGHALKLEGKPDEALAAWEEAVSHEPYQGEWRMEAGEAYLASGKAGDARRHFAAAAALAPENAVIQRRLQEAISRDNRQDSEHKPKSQPERTDL